ncbi:MAG: SH3 domain-containing protein [Anaerolineaceae bacterium]
MTLPTSEPVRPDRDENISAARKRRQKRLIVPNNADEKTAFVSELAQRVTPSFEFLLFSLLAGLILIAAILLNSPALFILAAIASPFMAPVVGLSLASIIGSRSFFFQSLGAILLGSLLVFTCGALAGWFAYEFPGLYVQQALLHANFTWPDLLLVTIGAVLTTYFVMRAPHQKPLVTSVALAYELYLPAGVAGFGLTSQLPGFWPDGLIVFGVYLAWSALIGVAVLAALGFRPMISIGYTIGTSVVMIGMAVLVVLSGFEAAARFNIAQPPSTPTHTATITLTPTITNTPVPPTVTRTPTNTLVPSLTPTRTGTPVPTAVWAQIFAAQYGGAMIREEPGFQGASMMSLMNGNIVQILPQTMEVEGVVWVQVKTGDGKIGWIVRSLLVTATPLPTP